MTHQEALNRILGHMFNKEGQSTDKEVGFYCIDQEGFAIEIQARCLNPNSDIMEANERDPNSYQFEIVDCRIVEECTGNAE